MGSGGRAEPLAGVVRPMDGWMERDDKGLGVLFGIECGVTDVVIDAMKVFLEQVWKKREIQAAASLYNIANLRFFLRGIV